VNVVTEISKSGDNIIMARVRPYKTVTNTLTLGKDCELENIKGEKVTVWRVLDNLILFGVLIKHVKIFTNAFFFV